MKNYKKITIKNGPFVQDILFPIDELSSEIFNNYMVGINELSTITNGKVEVKDVSYKKVPKGFQIVYKENIG